MHLALTIQEILLDIFEHCLNSLPSSETPASELLALARTCHAFKEPALDVLWATLPDASPIARCLVDASSHSPSGTSLVNKEYRFTRSLSQLEWGILRNYARRIRSIRRLSHGLDWDSVRIFLDPATTEPLFPNLRHLDWGFLTESMVFLANIPFPSLISLRVTVLTMNSESLHVLQNTLESFSNFSSSIRRLSICLEQSDIAFSSFFSSHIDRWKNLLTLECGSISLDMDALAHLSHMPTLMRLTFRPSAPFQNQIPLSQPPLFFSSLQGLSLYSEHFGPISCFLTQIRLPAILDLSASIELRPSKLAVDSFLASVQTSVVGRTIQELSLVQISSSDEGQAAEASKPVLSLQDLQVCTTFRNLRRIHFDVEWNVDLSSDDVLTLASAWPRLEHILINKDWGWNTPGGITPAGVLQLLGTCRSLRSFALAIDTRGTGVSSLARQAGLTRTLPPEGSIDVLDSVLDANAVPAMAMFLASIAPRADFSFLACRGWFMPEKGSTVHWYEAYRRANDILKQRS